VSGGRIPVRLAGADEGAAVKLRGRFTVTLALAALAPITIAAVMTTTVFSERMHQDYVARRTQAREVIDRELLRLKSTVRESATSLASHDHPFVGNLLSALYQGHGTLDAESRRRLREQAAPTMRGLSLDILTITGPDDVVLVSPHYRAKIGDPNPLPVVRQRAEATGGEPFFTRDAIWTGHTVETVLVVESAQLSRDNGITVAITAGRRIADDLIAPVRQPGFVDARIVSATNEVILPPANGDATWKRYTKDGPNRTPMFGPDGTTVVAFIEVAVSDKEIDRVLRDFALLAALIALGALGVVVLIGLLVARRTARDLDRLVQGSIAAARGDLDHRVPVRSKDEVGEVAAAFNFMMEDLKTAKERLVIAERIAAWQEIARRLAHEIKNPLTPIQMAMDTLRKSWKKQHPEFGEILDESTTTVLEEADRLKRIVAEFSDFARMPKPEFARIDLNDVVRSALALYKDATPSVESKLDPKLQDLDADKGQLNQVVLNLVENAREALGQRDGGRITVTTRRGDTDDRALLVVEDNGPGVPGELKDKVFAPYFTTKHAKGGTGLGLAIVHRIVNDHGGRITISDASGGGARFAIELPLRNGTALLASRI
jgi:two-component system, NtrC family, nitrogen regulation sensor histidine kinase NtrY